MKQEARTEEQLSRITHDCMDAGGRATQETKPRNSYRDHGFVENKGSDHLKISAVICGFALTLALILLHTNIVFAAFSAFVVITPDNEAEYPFLIQAQPLENQPGYTRVRVIGPVEWSKRAWLIECKQSLLPESQNFRTTIWDGKEHNDEIVNITQLKPGQISLPETGSQQYAYVEVVLSSAEMQRSYLYIDFPREVRDGGYYYSIDLAYYLEGALGKKRQIQWEKD